MNGREREENVIMQLKAGGIYDRKAVPAGTVFIRQGTEGYDAFLIQAGRVRVFREENSTEIDLVELEEGNIIGEIALIMDEPRTASVQAITDVTLVIITREDFQRMMLKSDQTVQSVLKLLSTRLKARNAETVAEAQEKNVIDPDALLITQSFARNMKPDRKALFIEMVAPHMSALIKALKAFKG